MTRAGAFLRLVARFPYEVVRSSWDISLLIVSGRPLAPGEIEVPYGNLSPNGAAIVSALVTLTPGTTVVGVDSVRRCFRVHVLDRNRADAAMENIHEAFLRPAAVIFGEEA